METTHESSKQTLCSAQPAKPYAFSRKVFCEGMRDGVPIALGYFAVSFSLGIAARTAGFTPLQGFVASLLNNASAGEYAPLPSLPAARPISRSPSSPSSPTPAIC